MGVLSIFPQSRPPWTHLILFSTDTERKQLDCEQENYIRCSFLSRPWLLQTKSNTYFLFELGNLTLIITDKLPERVMTIQKRIGNHLKFPCEAVTVEMELLRNPAGKGQLIIISCHVSTVCIMRHKSTIGVLKCDSVPFWFTLH